MPTIFLATEADEGMGHIAPWRDFIRLSLCKGHNVHMAAPDVAQLESLLGNELAANIWQAPRLRCDRKAAHANPRSWPELLLHLGYGDATQLGGVVKAWVNVLTASGASVVIADYAPAVQLAARVLGLPVIEAGGGFCVPPLAPAQCFPGASKHDPAVVKNAEAALCKAFNAVLQTNGRTDILRSLAGFAAGPARRVVLSPPQLDHYGKRAGVAYLGLLGLGSLPGMPAVPATNYKGARPVPQVVGYLKSGTPGLTALIAQLAEAGVAAQLYVPGSDASVGSGSVRVSGRPLELQQLMTSAAVYLSNGGLNGVGQALHHGCWPVVVPMQAEQVAMTRQLVSQRLGSLYMADTLTGDQLKKMFSPSKFAANRSLPPPPPCEAALLALVEELSGSDASTAVAAAFHDISGVEISRERYARSN